MMETSLLQGVGMQFSVDEQNFPMETNQKGINSNSTNLNEAPFISTLDTNQMPPLNSVLDHVFNITQEQLGPDISCICTLFVVEGQLFHINCSPASSSETRLALSYCEVRNFS
jgi:hypothetical protein